jgi:hypothetical protein
VVIKVQLPIVAVKLFIAMEKWQVDVCVGRRWNANYCEMRTAMLNGCAKKEGAKGMP